MDIIVYFFEWHRLFVSLYSHTSIHVSLIVGCVARAIITCQDHFLLSYMVNVIGKCQAQPVASK